MVELVEERVRTRHVLKGPTSNFTFFPGETEMVVGILLEITVGPSCPSPFSKHNSVVTEPVKQRKKFNQTSLIFIWDLFLSLGSY